MKAVDPHTAELLELPLRSKVVEFEIRVYTNTQPLGHIVSAVPYRLGRHVSAARLEQKPLVFLLAERCQVRISQVDQWTSAAEADGKTAGMLGIAPGAPTLIIRRLFFEADGRPAQVSVNTFRGDRFRHHVHLSWTTPEASRRPQRSATEA